MDLKITGYVAVFLRTIVAINLLDLKFPKYFKTLFTFGISLALGSIVQIEDSNFFYFKEILMGIFLGLFGRITISLLNNVAELLGYSIGLQNQVFIGNSNENTHINALVYYATFNFLLASGLDHASILILAKSYTITFSNGFMSFIIAVFKSAFFSAVTLCTPIIIISFIFNLVCASLSKAIQQIPIFFLMQSIVLLGIGYFIGPKIAMLIREIPKYIGV